MVRHWERASRKGGPHFVIYLDVAWESQFVKNRQHFVVAELARQLGKRSTVLAVERPVCLTTAVLTRDRRRLSTVLNQRSALQQQTENLFTYTPFVGIHDRVAAYLPGASWLNRRLLSRNLKAVLRSLDIGHERLVSWVHHPYQAPHIGLIDEQALVYDCYDDYLGLWWMSRRQRKNVEAMERDVLHRANVVFTASRKLSEEKRQAGGKVRYVPNGADAEHFGTAGDHGTAVDPEIEALPRPVIGFSGRLGRRIDFSLISHVAERRRYWSIVLVGPAPNRAYGGIGEDLDNFEDFRRLKLLPNVHMLGEKRYEDMPRYLKGFDVCVIPYVQDSFNVSSCPLKLYEYMATGKPVVSVSLPEVDRFNGLVRIARDREEFLVHCEQALREDDAEIRKKRRQVANQSSWKHRVGEMLAAVEDSLAGP